MPTITVPSMLTPITEQLGFQVDTFRPQSPLTYAL